MLRSLLFVTLIGSCFDTANAAATTPPAVTAQAQAAADVLQAIDVDRTIKPLALRMAGFIAEQIGQWQVTPAQQPAVNATMTKIQDLLITELSWKNMHTEYEMLYQESFSTEELRDIARFFQTPTGRKYLATVPGLQEKALVISEQHLTAIQPQIQLLIEDLQRHLLATAPKPSPNDAAKAPDNHAAAREGALLEAEQGGRTR